MNWEIKGSKKCGMVKSEDDGNVFWDGMYMMRINGRRKRIFVSVLVLEVVGDWEKDGQMQ